MNIDVTVGFAFSEVNGFAQEEALVTAALSPALLMHEDIRLEDEQNVRYLRYRATNTSTPEVLVALRHVKIELRHFVAKRLPATFEETWKMFLKESTEREVDEDLYKDAYYEGASNIMAEFRCCNTDEMREALCEEVRSFYEDGRTTRNTKFRDNWELFLKTSPLSDFLDETRVLYLKAFYRGAYNFVELCTMTPPEEAKAIGWEIGLYFDHHDPDPRYPQI